MMRSVRSLAAAAAIVMAAVACGGNSGTSGGGASCSKTYKVGLVTDVGKLSDKSFNATSWQGVVDAQNDKSLCVQGKAIESNQPTDYAKNMQTFVDQGYDMVVAVGFLMGDDTLAGVKYTNPSAKVLEVYQGPGDGAAFNNPDWGKARAIDEINQNADIIFGGGGNTGNGALLGALSKQKACIGVDTDQFVSYPDADG